MGERALSLQSYPGVSDPSRLLIVSSLRGNFLPGRRRLSPCSSSQRISPGRARLLLGTGALASSRARSRPHTRPRPRSLPECDFTGACRTGGASANPCEI